jgi:hypothetical protein
VGGALRAATGHPELSVAVRRSPPTFIGLLLIAWIACHQLIVLLAPQLLEAPVNRFAVQPLRSTHTVIADFKVNQLDTTFIRQVTALNYLKTAANAESIAVFHTRHKDLSEMSKSQDAKKDKKKQPQKSAKEKRQAKREKRNK